MSPKKKPTFSVKAFLAEAGAGRSVKKYATNQNIFSQSDPADALFYLQKGKVKLTVISTRGKQAVIALLDAGAFFGEGSVAGQTVRTSTASAISECLLVRVEKEAALGVMHREPAFSEVLLRYMLSRNIRIEEDLVDQLFNSSEKRLARVLLLLANFGKEDQPAATIPKISQETLAEMIGTTRSRVSFFMTKFRRLGFISYKNGLEIHSSLLNVILRD